MRLVSVRHAIRLPTLTVIDFETQSSMQHLNNEELNKSLIRRRLSKDGQKFGPDYVVDMNNQEEVIEKVKEFLEKEESCKISGRIPLKKVTGQIRISFHSKGHIAHEINNRYPELGARLNMEHRFESMTFGDP